MNELQKAAPAEEVCPVCSQRKKVRDPKELRDLTNRLCRIEGQIRGIRNMLENSAYCPDVLMQVSAATAALQSFSKALLAEHIRTCVSEDLKAGKDEAADELTQLLIKLMK